MTRLLAFGAYEGLRRRIKGAPPPERGTTERLKTPGELRTRRRGSCRRRLGIGRRPKSPPRGLPQPRPPVRAASAPTSAALAHVPAGYDARDTRTGETACRAFQALSLGACGACYAFAAAAAVGARVCRALRGRPSVGDVALSPQQLMDCTGGCDGGDELSAYAALAARPAVED